MPIQTVTQRNTLATAYAGAITHWALATSVPGASAGTEVTGGAPAYARKPANWAAASASAVVASPAAFDVPSGATLLGVNGMSALTAGTYLDGAGVTSQGFSSQGTYTVVITYTQT